MSLSVNKISMSPSFGNNDNKSKGPSTGKIVGEAVVAGGIGAGLGYGSYKLSGTAQNKKTLTYIMKDIKDAFNAEYKNSNPDISKAIKENFVRDILRKEMDELKVQKVVDDMRGVLPPELKGTVGISKLEEITRSYVEDVKNLAKPFEKEIAEYQATGDFKAILESENMAKKADGAIEGMIKANDTMVEKLESAAKKSFTKTKLAYAGLAAAGALGLYAGGRYIAAQAKKES